MSIVDEHLCFLFSYDSHVVEKRDTNDEVKVVGYRVEESAKDPQIEDGVPVLRAGSQIMLRLFGSGFKNKTKIGLTSEKLEYGGSCNMMITTGYFTIQQESPTNARVQVVLPSYSIELYICATKDDGVSKHVQPCRNFFN